MGYAAERYMEQSLECSVTTRERKIVQNIVDQQYSIANSISISRGAFVGWAQQRYLEQSLEAENANNVEQAIREYLVEMKQAKYRDHLAISTFLNNPGVIHEHDKGIGQAKRLSLIESLKKKRKKKKRRIRVKIYNRIKQKIKRLWKV